MMHTKIIKTRRKGSIPKSALLAIDPPARVIVPLSNELEDAILRTKDKMQFKMLFLLQGLVLC